MIERLLTTCHSRRWPAAAALARFALLGAMVASAPALAPTALAGQEPGTWEFDFAYVVPSMDKDPLVLDATATGDISGDGSSSKGLLTQTFTFPNSSFAALHLGYVWTFYLETEFTYDSNHFTSDYSLDIEDLGSGLRVGGGSGSVSTKFTTYQFSFLYHPVGNRSWRWQPFVLLGAGWIDVDFTPSDEVKSATESSLIANTFSTDFPPGDHGVMIDYGAGVKFFIRPEIAARVEWRTKQYDLLGDRRADRELNFGLSIFTAGYN